MKELSHNKTEILPYLFLMLCLALIYIPALLIPFAQHDDYFYFSYDVRNSITSLPQLPYIMVTGRGFYSVIAFIMSKFIWSIPDFTIIRVINVMLYTGVAIFLYRFFRNFKLSSLIAITMTLGIFTLPGFQLGMLWVSTMPFTIGFILSLFGGFCLNAMITADKKLGANKKVAFTLLSFTTFLLSLFIYQPWAMFFLLPTTGYLLFSSEDRTVSLKRFNITLLLFVMTSTVYFLIQKYIILQIPSLVPVFEDMAIHHSGYTFAIGSQLYQRIIDVSTVFLLQGGNLWFINNNSFFSIFLTSFIVITSILAYFSLEQGKNSGSKKMSSPLIALCSFIFLFLTSIPFLVSTYSASMVAYRVIVPFSTLMVLMLFWAIVTFTHCVNAITTNINRKLANEVIMTSLALVAAVLAFINIRNSALNNYQEFNFIKNEITYYYSQNKMLPELIKVHIIPSSITYSYSGHQVINDEFNYNSLSSFNDTPYLVRAALLSLGLKRSDIIVANTTREDPNIVNIFLQGRIIDPTKKATPFVINTEKFFSTLS